MIRVAIIGEQEVDELKLIPAFRPLADCKRSGTGAFPAVAMEAAWYARAASIPCGALFHEQIQVPDSAESACINLNA